VYDFETPLDRRTHGSIKWTFFDEDVLPMWVADMDFRSPPAILEALHARVDAGHFGYTMHAPSLSEAVVERMAARYGWTVAPEHLVYSPGLVVALNAVARAFGRPGDAILVQTPVYGPFLSAPGRNGRYVHMVDLDTVDLGDGIFSYAIDFAAFEVAAAHRQATMFYLCNPHNPAGRVFTRDELLRLGEICLRHDVLIIADEIHSDLLLDDHQHIPMASLSPELAARTVTLIAPSKSFNVPGLGCSVLIAADEGLRARLSDELWGGGEHVNALGFTAAEAAYRYGDPWLAEALALIQRNRDAAVAFIRAHMPAIRTTVPEGTYLMWLDCRALPVDDPAAFFLERARVALNPGQHFGPAGAGYCRLNLGCPRAQLDEALGRMRGAYDALMAAG
jgi:cysteine-S-conjugate beta-lyase